MSKQKSQTTRNRWIWRITFSLILFVTTLCFTSAKWYVDVYGDVGFDAVLYTLTSNLDGVEKGLVFSYIKDAFLYAVAVCMVLGFILLFPFRRQLVMSLFQRWKIRLYPMPKIVSSIVCIVLSCVMILQAATNVGLAEYLDGIRNPSTFYQDYYADPDKVKIEFPEKKKNLIYIFLESMETTYFSKEVGGALDKNAIPELYQLAKDNVSFSHNEDIGGFLCPTGTTWTIGAMVGHTSGVPLKLLPRQGHNDLAEDGSILPGATTLSDILKENGYYQCLMIGSKSEFGGRKQYFEGHGMDQIYDYYTAVNDGIIPEGYYVWWGMEDEYLFSYAKEKLLDISKQEKPFSFTMLTADTHHAGGYVCRLCDSDYEEQYENVHACSSRQVNNFVEWLKQQEFYQDTTIIIVGDHLTMDGGYITRNVPSSYSRHIYNCFINPATEAYKLKNRLFSTLDLFPTTLGAIGCTIEGNRLGLGTNLFSEEQTLLEEMGVDTFNQQESAFSSFYFNEFENSAY